MKKIGIITFHTALNYGAVLQAYALQNFLKDNNIDNEIIDYRSEYIERCYKPFFVSNGKYISSIARGLLFGNVIRKKREVFTKFVTNKLELGEKIESQKDLGKIDNKYACFITGSDQVWSPISAGFDPIYFLPGVSESKKFSYAASIGLNKVSPDIEKEMEKRLKEYKVISVREDSAKKMLEKLNITEDIRVHIDPTLLLSKEKWEKLDIKRVVKEKYVLIFNVEKPINDVEFAKKIAKERNLKVVYINDRTLKQEKEILYFKALSPEKFLSLFYYAENVVTNSFHGTVFSIIFQKDFYVELNNRAQKNIRVEGLLRKLDIKNRDIDSGENFEKIDWKKTETELKAERNNSLDYFKEIVELMA